MVLKLIDDMNRALEANCYFAALSIALMLPDICGKAEHPELKTGERYKCWFNEYIGKYEEGPRGRDENGNEILIPYLSGEVIYSLRNSFLHQGTPNVNKDRIKDNQNKIDYFELVIETKKPFDIYVDTSGIINGTIRTYRVNVRQLCFIIGSVSEIYYLRNTEKFDFFNYTVIDWDKENAKMKDLGY